jgi:hypothetical protein
MNTIKKNLLPGKIMQLKLNKKFSSLDDDDIKN